MTERVRLLLSDVDGTLVTPDKQLTPSSIRAVDALRSAGIAFAITSARPPRGLRRFVEPLGLTTPLGAFNGAVLINGDLSVIEQRTIPDDLLATLIDVLRSHAMSIWVFRGDEWLVRDGAGPHVDQESAICERGPTVVTDFAGVVDGVNKIVGVSDDAAASKAAWLAATELFGARLSATRSQTYYLDVTHPDATKGSVVRYLAGRYAIKTSEIATIGDMHNDVSMFEASGLSIAMGNAEPAVQRAAIHVTSSNAEEGFARAVDAFILR